MEKDQNEEKKGYQLTPVEIIGWVGAAALLYGYYLIQTKKVDHDNKLYIALNIIGASMIFINALSHKAYPSVVTNLVWIIIGSWSAYRIFYIRE